MSPRAFLPAALGLCLGLSAVAQELPPLKILVRPAKPGTAGPWSGPCEAMLNVKLTQAGLEVMALPPPGELERLAKAIGETDEIPSMEALAGADIFIHHEMVPEQAPGGAKTVKLRLEAIEQASGKAVASVLRTSTPFGEGPGQATRAVSETCSAGGAELLEQLLGYLESRARDGEPLRLEVRDPPAGLSQVLVPALKRACTKVKLEVDSGRRVVASASCKGEQYEVAGAVLEAVEAKFPKGACEKRLMQRGLVVLGCTP